MSIPKHIAIIMDGNGRWAKKRLLPRIQGHQRGVKTVRETVKYCSKLGVETLTLFAFSSENKNRSKEEVSLLFKLFLHALKQETNKLNKYNVALKIIGDLSFFSSDIQKSASEALQLLADNSGLMLVVAANYSGQWDIMQAVKTLAEKSAEGKISAQNITHADFSQHLSLASEPPLDLLIRTSGELRISNFLLWDIAYSELYFTDILWPDFNNEEMDKAIDSFNSRKRRFGVRDKSC